MRIPTPASSSGSIPPPGPQGRWPFGSLADFGHDVLGFLTRCAWEYGDIVFFRLGRWPTYLLCHPEHSEAVLLTRHWDFIKHRFFWRHVEALFGRCLLTSEGKFWHRQRHLIAPAFHRDRIAAYGATMVDNMAYAARTSA